MAKALGVDEAESVKDNLYLLSARLSGNSVGLVLTHADPDTLAAYCESNVHADYARAGSLATETVVIPMGTVMRNEEPMPHTLESQLRASGMPVLLKKGNLSQCRGPCHVSWTFLAMCSWYTRVDYFGCGLYGLRGWGCAFS